MPGEPHLTNNHSSIISEHSQSNTPYLNWPQVYPINNYLGFVLACDKGPVYTEEKRIYFHAVWPFIYTKTEVLSRKTIISKNSGQSGDF